jgi:rRNA-processing protein EBP2
MSESALWLETLDLYGPIDVEGLSVEQSAEIEKRMYQAALISAKEGYKRLSELKVPASRRPDYLAEMLKDDRQMTKIRENLVVAQQRIEAVESRKKKQAQRKFAKQIKAVRKNQKTEAAPKPDLKKVNSAEKIKKQHPTRPSGKKNGNRRDSKPKNMGGKPKHNRGRPAMKNRRK